MLRAEVVFVILSAVSVHGDRRSWSVQDLPDVNQQPCGQGFRICDPEGYFKGISRVEKAINVLEMDYEYPDCGGYEMGVVVVGSIQGGASSTAEFARGVMDSWGVGKQPCNNGIVLAMAIKDRQMFIATGRGAKENVPDAELSKVIERMRPLMRDGDYASAAEQCVSDIARILSGESFQESVWPSVLMFLGIGTCFLGAIARNRWQTRKYEECRRKLREIERVRSEGKAKQYKQESCPICLENFSKTLDLQTDRLPCGHVYHKGCIASWEDRSNTCPICRQSTVSTEPTRPAQPTPSRSSFDAPPHYYNSGMPHDLADFWEDEYRFRLMRAHHYYPRYVSNDFIHRYSRDPHYTGSMVSDTSFVRSSPNYVDPNARTSSSSGGGGGGFGGGGSSGGGGAGGGW